VQILDYTNEPSPVIWTPARIAILAITAVASCLTVLFDMHWLQEPFRIYRRSDAVLLVGLPAITLGLWLVVLALSLCRPRFPWYVLSLLLGWAIRCGLTAVDSIHRYTVREPWVWSTG
jgi:hypothetical protein